MAYKYNSAQEWLNQHINSLCENGEKDKAIKELMGIVMTLDGDTIGEYFESDMEADGYFDDINKFTVTFQIFPQFVDDYSVVTYCEGELAEAGCALIETGNIYEKVRNYYVNVVVESSLSIEELEELDSVVEVNKV